MGRKVASPCSQAFAQKDEPTVAVALGGELCSKIEQRVHAREPHIYKSRYSEQAPKASSPRLTNSPPCPLRRPNEAIFLKNNRTPDIIAATDQAMAPYNAQRGNDLHFNTSAFIDDRNQSNTRVRDTAEGRICPNTKQPRTESIIEKKKRMMQYKERLQKKFGSEKNQMEETSKCNELPKVSTSAPVADRITGGPSRRGRTATTCASTVQSPTTCERQTGRISTMQIGQIGRPRSRFRPHGGTGLDLSKESVPRIEPTKLIPKQSSERIKAPSRISIYETNSSRGSLRRNLCEMVAANNDSFTPTGPKSSRNQPKAPQRHRKPIETESQPEIVLASHETDDYNIGRVTSLAGGKQLNGEVPSLSTGRNLHPLPKSSPRVVKIRSPPHGVDIDVKRNEGWNYTSFIATFGNSMIPHKTLTELPSPQDHGLNAAGGSSIFSAITDADTAMEKQELPMSIFEHSCATAAYDKESYHPDLEIAASSSLFSFPSTNSGDQIKENYRLLERSKTDFNTFATDADDKSSLDSLYAGLDDHETPFAELDILIDRDMQQTMLAIPSVKSNVSDVEECMSDPPKVCDRPPLHESCSSGQESAKKIEPFSPTKRKGKVRQLFPFIFKLRGSNTIFLEDSNQDVEPSGLATSFRDSALTQPGSDDDDTRTMITVLEASEREGTGGAIEVLMSPRNSGSCLVVETGPLSIKEARSLASYKIQSPKLQRFSSLMGRVRSMRNPSSPCRVSAGRSKRDSIVFPNDDEVHLTPETEILHEVRLVSKECEPELHDLILHHQDVSDDLQQPQDFIIDLDCSDEHMTSVEVVPLPDGATYISAMSTGRRLSKHPVHPSPAITRSVCQPYGHFVLNPLLEPWTCVDTIQDDVGTPGDKNNGTSMASVSTKVESVIVVPPDISSDIHSALVPVTAKRTLFGIMRRPVRELPQVGVDMPITCPANGAINSSFFRKRRPLTPRQPAKEDGSTTRQASFNNESVEVEHLCDSSVDGAVSHSFNSRDYESYGSTTRATSITLSARKSHTKAAAPIDKAAQWLVQSFKGLVGTSSSGSDDNERQTTYSDSTGYDPSCDSEVVTEDNSSSVNEERRRCHKGQHVAVGQLDATISGLSDVASQESEQGTLISKNICDDLKRILAIAKQLDMAPELLIERIAAGESVEKLLHDRQS
ncbi:hypothetical protein MPSEU_000898500 [Mayamaea pseudoterrestris]|nr:hypothetical protein MPSEU_000898500 [Mayamaea pseudoterrestris]